MRKHLILAVLALVAFAAASPASARSARMEAPQPILVAGADGRPLDLDGTRAAIAAGATSAGWAVRDEAPGRTELRIMVRGKHVVVIAAVFTAGEVRFDYVSSEEMNHRVRRDGTVLIHPHYMSWRYRLEEAVRAAAKNVR